jgi:hypothetical protein
MTPERRHQRALQAEPECHDGNPPTTAHPCRGTSSSPDRRLRAPAPTNTPRCNPTRQNRPPCNHHVAACAAPVRLTRSSTSSFPSAGRITSTAADQAQTLNPHRDRTALFIPRVRSLEAFGRRPRRHRPRGSPASETLHTAQTLNPHRDRTALFIPRVRSLEAFGRRPRRHGPRGSPASETLHTSGLLPVMPRRSRLDPISDFRWQAV